MATADKLDRMLESKNQIKNAINEKGGSVTDTDPFRSYADKIKEIPSGSDIWTVQTDWYDIKTILEEDTEVCTSKIICLLSDQYDDKATTNQVRGAYKYKLSDGQTIRASSSQLVDITDRFDVSKDKECSLGYKTRYVIFYINTALSNLMLPDNILYTVFDNVKFSNNCFENKGLLEAIEFKRDTKYTYNNMFRMFLNCSNLQKIPSLDTSQVTNMDSMFYNCSSLRKIPNIDTSKVTNTIGMFSNCNNLKEIPAFDLSKVTGMNYMFSNCSNLRKIPALNTISVTNIETLFSNCYGLQELNGLNFNSITNANYAFGECLNLTKVQINGTIKTNLSFASSSKLSHSSLINIINALEDLTGKTTQVLTLGSANLAKLTEEEKAIATNKNWTLA